MYRDSVFVFSPKGQLVRLPAGATTLDFAYAVHTEIGDTTIGARINGQERPLRTVLENGDTVEVLRGERPAAQPHWESLAVTGRARSAIRRLTRTAERGEFVAIGHRLIEHALRRIGLDPNEVDQAEMADRTGFEKIDGLAEAVGRGRLSTADMLEKAFPGLDDPGRQIPASPDVEGLNLVAGGEMTAGVTIAPSPNAARLCRATASSAF